MMPTDNKYRTDIAYEELLDEGENEYYSYHIQQYAYCICNHVKILKEDGILKRKSGEYIGVEFTELQDHQIRDEIVQICTDKLKKLIKDQPNKVLVVGLGNQEVIADALGNETAKQVFVTAHLKQENIIKVAVNRPGVMGQTGLKTVHVVKSIVDYFKPDLIIAIDALATRHLERVNRVIQITNTGIEPGSGIRNEQLCLNENSMQVPVIAIGVSTVIDIASILYDLTKSDTNYNQSVSVIVTPKEMDYELLYLSNMLARIINQCLYTQE